MSQGLKRGAAFGHVVDLPSTADVHVEDKGGVQTGLGVQRAGERIADSVDVPLGCVFVCTYHWILSRRPLRLCFDEFEPWQQLHTFQS